MTLDDVMTTLEAGERWGVTPNALKQNCQGRVKNGVKEGEDRKSGAVAAAPFDSSFGITICYLK